MKRFFMLLMLLPCLGFSSTIIAPTPRNPIPPNNAHGTKPGVAVITPSSPRQRVEPDYYLPRHEHPRKRDFFARRHHRGHRHHHH